MTALACLLGGGSRALNNTHRASFAGSASLPTVMRVTYLIWIRMGIRKLEQELLLTHLYCLSLDRWHK